MGATSSITASKRKLFRNALINADTELQENERLSPETLDSIIEIASLPMPGGRWPNVKSYKFRAFSILRQDSKDIIKRWKMSYRKQIIDEYTNGKGQFIHKGEKAYMHKLFSGIDTSIDSAVLDYRNNGNNTDMFYLGLKKGLYSKINKYGYKFLEELPDHHFVKIIRGIQQGDERSMSKLYHMKRRKMLKELEHLRIPWSDKNTIVGLALLTTAKNMLFVGGFDNYARLCLKGEVRKFYKDFTPDGKTYSYRRELEKEIADTSSIKLFDSDTYEELLERSETANAYHGYIRTSLSPYPEKLNEKISNLVDPRGIMISEYLQKAVPALYMLRHNIGTEQPDILSLFRGLYPEVPQDVFDGVMKSCIDGTASEKNLEIFNKQKEELMLKRQEEQDKLVASLRKIPKMEQVYLSIVSRIIIPAEEELSSLALSYGDGYREMTDTGVKVYTPSEVGELISKDIGGYVQDAVEKFRGFELLPQEIKEQAVLSKIRGEKFHIPDATNIKKSVLGNLGSICLKEDNIKELSKFGNVRDILHAFYDNDLLILDEAPRNIGFESYFKARSVVGGTELVFSNSGCVFNTLERKLGNHSSYVTRNIIDINGVPLQVFEPKKSECILQGLEIMDIWCHDELNYYLEKLGELKSKALTLEKQYTDVLTDHSILPKFLVENFRLVNEAVIYTPESLFPQKYTNPWATTFERMAKRAHEHFNDNLWFLGTYADMLDKHSLEEHESNRLMQILFDSGSKLYLQELHKIFPPGTLEASKSWKEQRELERDLDDIPF